MSVKAEILDGMAKLLWGSAWATHAEGHRCTSLSGQEITEIMPRVPPLARSIAKKWAASIESANRATLDELWKRAVAADAKEGKRQGTPEAFGGDLVMEAAGSGVSWFDDHAEFAIKFRTSETRAATTWICNSSRPTSARTAVTRNASTAASTTTATRRSARTAARSRTDRGIR